MPARTQLRFSAASSRSAKPSITVSSWCSRDPEAERNARAAGGHFFKGSSIAEPALKP